MRRASHRRWNPLLMSTAGRQEPHPLGEACHRQSWVPGGLCPLLHGVPYCSSPRVSAYEAAAVGLRPCVPQPGNAAAHT